MPGLEIRARVYDGKSSAAALAHLSLVNAEGTPYLSIDMEGKQARFALAEVTIGDRVGSIPRRLILPDRRSIEVIDNSEFDLALRDAGGVRREPLIRRLERSWRYAVVAGVVIIVGTGAFLRYGAPALADRAVRFIPPAVDAAIGADTLRILDKTVFKPSTLGSERQKQLQALFAEVAATSSNEGGTFRLELREGGPLKANALALPSGIVILTDELERLAIDDNELKGVFAHEVGHLVNRHAMRRLVQSSTAALLLGGIFGDVSGVPTLTITAPTVLVDSAYSRNFEREADDFAFRWMAQHNVAPEELGNLLARVAKTYGESQGGYLASHPSSRERVKAAQASHAASSRP